MKLGGLNRKQRNRSQKISREFQEIYQKSLELKIGKSEKISLKEYTNLTDEGVNVESSTYPESGVPSHDRDLKSYPGVVTMLVGEPETFGMNLPIGVKNSSLEF